MSTMHTVESLVSQLLSGDVSVLPVLEDAILEGVSDAGKSTYMLVFKRGYKRGSHVVPSSKVDFRFAVVTPADKKSGKDATIRIFGLYYPKGNRVGELGAYDRTFTIGDTAEYDSFNLNYLGSIESIGAGGNVTIFDHGKRTRLNVDQFTFRNWDLDVAETMRKNSETMMYI